MRRAEWPLSANRRAGVFYSEDTEARKQHSLRTKDEAEALTLLHSKNEARRQPVLNLHIARTYLTATDPGIAKRTWQGPMDEMTRTKTGPMLIRYKRAMQDRAFDIIRDLPILETHSIQFLKVLVDGVRHLRQPRTVFEKFQHIRSREKLDAVRRRVAQWFEEPGRVERRNIVRLAVQDPRRLFGSQAGGQSAQERQKAVLAFIHTQHPSRYPPESEQGFWRGNPQ